MDYTLAVLTHGNLTPVNQAISSFLDKVKPHPSRILVYADGATSTMPWSANREPVDRCEVRRGAQPLGFCKATGKLWHWASAPGEPGVELPPYVFWLEHDFVFLRPVDLADLAYVLNADKSVCQMQLMRGPVSREEIAAGGLYEMRRDDYEREHVGKYDIDASVDAALTGWLRHRSYFTTNPSLMRTDFMMWNQWPDDDEPHCEGRFGIDLVSRGFSYGVWGSGEPWVEHRGRRTGFGY